MARRDRAVRVIAEVQAEGRTARLFSDYSAEIIGSDGEVARGGSFSVRTLDDFDRPVGNTDALEEALVEELADQWINGLEALVDEDTAAVMLRGAIESIERVAPMLGVAFRDAWYRRGALMIKARKEAEERAANAPRLPCPHCSDASCVLCDDDGMVPA